MAVLGKRKAPEPTISDRDAQDIFRRHFEARFNPLPSDQADASTDSGEEEEEEEEEVDEDQDIESNSGEEDEDWGGISDDDEDEDEEGEGAGDDTPTVEIVDHSVSHAPTSTTMSKRELKAFMSSRPPSQTPSNPPPPSRSAASTSTSLPEDAPSLLAQDLELRRLLSESHLLSRSSSSSSSSATLEPRSFTTGRIRQKATDLRIQALGSRDSILKQDKMPMHMRKGISAAASARETKRRREAKENGIILEREVGKNTARKGRRGGGGAGGGLDVGRPGVGRMKGAELRISERDVKSIEGTRDTFGRRGKR